MKTYLFTLTIIILAFISCKKKDDATINNLKGTWKLIEVLEESGNGSGIFNPVSSNKQLIFDKRGNVTSNGSICDMSIEINSSSNGTYSVLNSTINSTNCQNRHIKFELKGNDLILIYPCFEACKSKYTKIQ